MEQPEVSIHQQAHSKTDFVAHVFHSIDLPDLDFVYFASQDFDIYKVLPTLLGLAIQLVSVEVVPTELKLRSA